MHYKIGFWLGWDYFVLSELMRYEIICIMRLCIMRMSTVHTCFLDLFLGQREYDVYLDTKSE